MAKVMNEAEYRRRLQDMIDRDINLLRSLRPADAITFVAREILPFLPSTFVYIKHTILSRNDSIVAFDIVLQARYYDAGVELETGFSYLTIRPGSLRKVFPTVRPWTAEARP